MLTKSLLLSFIFGILLVASSVINTQPLEQDSIESAVSVEEQSISQNQTKQKNPKGTAQRNQNAIENGADPSEMGNGKKIGLNMTFDDFKTQFRKSYAEGAQEIQTKRNFERNLENLKKADCFPCGVTSLFDRSPEDLTKLLGLNPEKAKASSQDSNLVSIDDSDLNEPLSSSTSTSTSNLRRPSSGSTQTTSTTSTGALGSTPGSFDWRTYGAVTPVKDQGNCGSCWAFTAAAFLESESIRRKRASNTLNLAEHYLNQCDTSSYGCNGGFPFNAAALGIRTGMPLQSTYPYRIGFTYSSTMCTAPIVATTYPDAGNVIYYSRSTRSNDSTLITYLLQRPIMIGVNANDWFNYYPSLTATITQKTLFCSSANSLGSINHAVLLVGYTSGAWLIKNSWGTGWGDRGYVWVTRSSSRSCGVGYYWGTLSSTLARVV